MNGYIIKQTLALICCWMLMAEMLSVQNNRFIKLLPDHIKFHYACGIDFVSIGFGYQSRNQKFEGDIYYGYVPASAGGINIHSDTAKISWFPVKKITKNNL